MSFFLLNKKILFTILFIESIFIFFFAPNHYEYRFNLFCVIQFVVSCIVFFLCKRKNNYFDFDSIFILSYFFVMFFYPVFLYPIDPVRFFAFQYDFNESVISKSTALSLLGIHAYFLGSVVYRPKQQKVLKEKRISPQLFSILAIISFIIYISLGGYAELKGLYKGEISNSSSIANYFYLFTCICIFAMLVVLFNNSFIVNKRRLNVRSLSYSSVLFVAFFVLLILTTGSRTIPLQIVLIFLGLYTYLYKNLKVLPTFIYLLLGGLLMFSIMIIRSSDAVQINSFADIVMDLVVNNRNSFIAVDYVDEKGISYGVSMLSNILAPIPFLQQIIYNLFDINPDVGASSIIITRLTLGSSDSKLGLGTNIIADIYMAFGLWGVMIMMFGLGYFISYLLVMAKRNVYALTSYAIMISYAVFLVRAEYFFFLRALTWCLVIINITRNHPINIVYQLKK